VGERINADESAAGRPSLAVSDDDTLTAWIDHVDGLMRARGTAPFVMLVVALNVGSPPNAHSRHRMAKWLSECEPYRRQCLRSVFVLSNPIVRGTMTVIDWISRPNPPRTLVGTTAEALAICRRELGSAGQLWPAGVERSI